MNFNAFYVIYFYFIVAVNPNPTVHFAKGCNCEMDEKNMKKIVVCHPHPVFYIDTLFTRYFYMNITLVVITS